MIAAFIPPRRSCCALLLVLLLCTSCLFSFTAAAAPKDSEVVSSSVCPGSPAGVHAKCDLTVEFPSTPCDMVQVEIVARLENNKDWTDPHNGGTYTLLHRSEPTANDGVLLQASRVTGDGRYTDLLGLRMVPSSSNQGCTLHACSESQVTSVLDFSTNYCNLHNLYCGTKEECPYVKHSFDDYEERYQACWQRDASKCVVKTKET